MSSRVDEPPLCTVNYLNALHDMFLFYFKSADNVLRVSYMYVPRTMRGVLIKRAHFRGVLLEERGSTVEGYNGVSARVLTLSFALSLSLLTSQKCMDDWEIFTTSMSSIFNNLLCYLTRDQHSVPSMLSPIPFATVDREKIRQPHDKVCVCILYSRHFLRVKVHSFPCW